MRPELRSELLHRAKQDQAARSDNAANWELVLSVDTDNLAWLKVAVADVGWPVRSMVGEDGAHAAWLLAQHADRDPAFQRTCMDLMSEAVAHGEASKAELAYLTDRVLLAEGYPQEYGTQMTGRSEGWVPRRLRDPDHVDQRRATMELGPLAEYIADMGRAYGPATPMRADCGACGAGIDIWPPDDGEIARLTCPECGWTATVSTS